jgi:diguanylate cyclase (GGDEF)-like protein
MPVAASVNLSFLDGPTVAFIAVCIVALLGLLLILAWLQQRDARALAWWGAAYLIGASSLALWGAPTPWVALPPEIPFAMIFGACGMIWNGVRLFRGRPLLPVAAFAGAVVWLALCQLPYFADGSPERIVLGAVVVSVYTFFIAFELSRERRRSLHSRTAAVIVPFLHSAIFLLPLAMRSFTPEVIAASWLTVFALETIVYAVGLAFIVLLMVKDQNLGYYRRAAATDFLTGLANRRAFLEGALKLCAESSHRRPVTLMMFDLDHFKKVNDRFGHAVGDEVLRVFAQSVRRSMRLTDIIGRIGGEEFAAIIDEPMHLALPVAERVRSSFEKAGVTVMGYDVHATVSIGLATSEGLVTNIDALIACADDALYRAKRTGRNRVHTADTAPPKVVAHEQASNVKQLFPDNHAA